jgi:hypothetical protein
MGYFFQSSVFSVKKFANFSVTENYFQTFVLHNKRAFTILTKQFTVNGGKKTLTLSRYGL